MGVANFVVLVTDGASNSSQQTISEAFLAKRANIHFVVIGVGQLVNTGELLTLANYPYSVNYLPASGVGVLPSLMQTVLELVCNSKCSGEFRGGRAGSAPPLSWATD